ncbi:ERAD-associated protein [Physocladia obscura]|uniref:ERAD-associated protein n=1 Tax=Physocladia obscura TaxID=109957 RepID=A0AAD5SVH4_9FUNG|nr:ERAD-associated protein [Physocladia obscura]
MGSKDQFHGGESTGEKGTLEAPSELKTRYASEKDRGGIKNLLVLGSLKEPVSVVSKIDDTSADSKARLAKAYFHGIDGFEQDYLKAAELFRAVNNSTDSINNDIDNTVINFAATLFLPAAEQGSPEAMFVVARAYFAGEGGLREDKIAALHWYRCAANEHNLPAAQFFLGNLYSKAITVCDEPDYIAAAAWFEKAAVQGYSRAQFNLANAYHTGLGVPRDDVLAVHWFEKAAVQGLARAQFSLGNAYFLGIGGLKDHTLAIDWLGRAAEQGFVQAQYNLALIYYEGEVSTDSDKNTKSLLQDYSKAAQWFQRAAEQGHSNAQLHLGIMHHNGMGVSQDDNLATRYFYLSAAQENASAQYNLAAIYYNGLGISSPDFSQAIHWFEKAAINGHATAQYDLGLAYYNGAWAPLDIPRAIKLFQSAAAHPQQPHPRAACMLGLAYQTGKVTTAAAPAMALEWYLKAASLGDAQAHYHLGVVYAKGLLNVLKNNDVAIQWFKKAEQLGHSKAQELLLRNVGGSTAPPIPMQTKIITGQLPLESSTSS